MMSQCLFCKSDRSQNTIILTNGETLHSRCYDNFLKRKDEHAQKISQYKDHVKKYIWGQVLKFDIRAWPRVAEIFLPNIVANIISTNQPRLNRWIWGHVALKT